MSGVVGDVEWPRGINPDMSGRVVLNDWWPRSYRRGERLVSVDSMFSV
jgi:hypothetical protein